MKLRRTHSMRWFMVYRRHRYAGCNGMLTAVVSAARDTPESFHERERGLSGFEQRAIAKGIMEPAGKDTLRAFHHNELSYWGAPCH